MADLSKRLPTEVDSQQRFVSSAPAAPSFLTSLADFGSGMVGVVDKAITTIDRNNKKDAELSARNDAAKGFAQIFSEPDAAPQGVANTVTNDPAHNAAVSQARGAAQTVVNQQTASNQGTIDPAMAQARGLAVLRQVMAAHPGHEAAVVSTFKELGVTNMITQQYANAETAIQSDQSAQQATQHKLEDTAVNKYGYTNFYQMSKDDQAKTLARVGNLEAQEADLESQTKLADLSVKQAGLTKDQTDALIKQNSSNLFDSASKYMSGNFSNITKLLINQLGDPTLANQSGRLEQLQSHVLNVALPALDLQYNTQKARMGSLLSPEDSTRLDTAFQQQRTALVNIISGPQSVVEMNKRVLENITTTMGIDYSKAAPTLMNLQKLIGPQAVGVLLSPSIQGNKPLMDMLSNELKGVMQDPSKMPSFTEFVQSLNGQVDPSTWTPEKVRAMAPAAISATASMAKDPPIFNGTDKEGHKALVNSVKQTAGIAVDVVPQWGFGNVLTQGKVLNSRGVTTALFNSGANKPEQMDAIRSWVPAVTRTYETLGSMRAGDNFYDVKLDPHTLTWSAVWNGKADTRQVPGVLGGFGQSTSINSHPAPTTKVLEQVSTLNHMLNNLSDAASKGFDNSFGGKSVPYQEARKYFATGEMPQSLNKTKDKNGKTPEQNVDDAISHMLDFVNKLPSPSAVPAHAYTEVVASAASKYGVPADLAQRLIHQESRGQADAVSPKGAVGLGQIMPSTAQRYGKDVNKLTPEENVDLAMHILSDNYKQTGNWEDAVSMYHSGHRLADAARLNLNDGGISTVNYTAGVAGISGISAENLARYGYVRR